jgi:hypothetical protein
LVCRGERGEEKEENGGAHYLEGGVEGLQEWRLGGGIWRGPKIEGHLEVLLELIFCTQPPNFGVEAHMEAPTGVASGLNYNH